MKADRTIRPPNSMLTQWFVWAGGEKEDRPWRPQTLFKSSNNWTQSFAQSMFSIEQGCLIAPLFCHRPLIVRRSIRIRVRHVFLDRDNSQRVNSSPRRCLSLSLTLNLLSINPVWWRRSAGSASQQAISAANDHVGFVDPISSESKIHREGS